MGGCASKPKDFDQQEAPAPAEAPVTPHKPEAEAVPQEKTDGGETKEEKPLVDLSEPAPAAEAPKTEEAPATAEAKTEAVPAESKAAAEEAVKEEAPKPAAEPSKEEEETKEVAEAK